MQNPAVPPPPTVPAAQTGIVVKTSFLPLAFLMYLCTPRIEVNGHVHIAAWGEYFFPLPPGVHRITCYFPYLFASRCGDATVDVQVAPNTVTRVEWSPSPWIIYLPGAFTVYRPRM